jgi:hypothetical protein
MENELKYDIQKLSSKEQEDRLRKKPPEGGNPNMQYQGKRMIRR